MTESLEGAQWQSNHNLNHQEPQLTPNLTQPGYEDPWRTHNILSLDGGGIRGYFTLLVLEKLMELIALEERKHAEPHERHSFWPESLPSHVSQLMPNGADHDADQEEPKRPDVQRYLPCHYFDLICGSSTGALIAIMLGRFRMTVPDCKHEYETLGNEVFGRPRKVHTQKFFVGRRPKYNARDLEKVCQNFARRRNDQSAGDFEKARFPSGKGLCACLVTSRTLALDRRSDKTYLLRSYDHKRRASIDIGQAETPGPIRTQTSNLLNGTKDHTDSDQKLDPNYGCSQDFEIWQVARAATAAKLFFKPLAVRFENRHEQSYVEFTDGGLDQSNNPVMDAATDIENLYGRNTLGIIVSVGTARTAPERAQPGDQKRRHFRGAIRELFDEAIDTATDPERSHTQMVTQTRSRKDFTYFRLNKPNGLDIKLDEWKPKKSRRSSKAQAGSETIKKCEEAFKDYYHTERVRSRMQECAEQLVNSRRRRMDTPQWERFATGVHYECREPGCGFQTFVRKDFRDHLGQPPHGFAGPRVEQKVRKFRECWRYKPAPTSL